MNDVQVFSNASRAPPRWAKAIGPGWSRKAKRAPVTAGDASRPPGPATGEAGDRTGAVRPAVVRSDAVATSRSSSEAWPRPVPTIGDRSSAAERAADPRGWAFPPRTGTPCTGSWLPAATSAASGRIRSTTRCWPGSWPPPTPPPRSAIRSRGGSSWWPIPVTRARAAVLADRARLAQAAAMEPDAGRHLLDLDLEGIREAPVGLVVCCDRRAAPAGVLGRATFVDADLWSCACAIENLWLAARAEGLGVGWVTLFEPGELAALVGAPEGVATLGWLCVGWPDERPPAPGLERRGWSARLPLDSLVLPRAAGRAGRRPGPAPARRRGWPPRRRPPSVRRPRPRPIASSPRPGRSASWTGPSTRSWPSAPGRRRARWSSPPPTTR